MIFRSKIVLDFLERRNKMGLRYKIGDRVVIKPWGLMVKQFGFFGTEIKCKNTFTCEMERNLKGTDRVITINYVCSEGHPYETDVLLKGCVISDDMILGYAFEYGEEIEVGDISGEWNKHKFVSYIPGDEWPVNTDCSHYRFGRPIRKPEIEITIKINGEVSKLSDISEETLAKIRNQK